MANFSKYTEILWFDHFLIMIKNLNDETNGTIYTKKMWNFNLPWQKNFLFWDTMKLC